MDKLVPGYLKYGVVEEKEHEVYGNYHRVCLVVLSFECALG